MKININNLLLLFSVTTHLFEVLMWREHTSHIWMYPYHHGNQQWSVADVTIDMLKKLKNIDRMKHFGDQLLLCIAVREL